MMSEPKTRLETLPGVKSVNARDDGGVGVLVARFEDHPNPATADDFRDLGFTIREEKVLAGSRGFILDPEDGEADE